MDSAGPGPAYFKNPYRGLRRKRQRAAPNGIVQTGFVVVAEVADPGEWKIEESSPTLRHKSRGEMRWSRRGVFSSALFLACSFLLGTTGLHAEMDAPPTGFVPPVRAAPPPATRSLLLDAYVLGASIFAVGERGALIRSDDSGQNWDTIDLSVAATFTGITFADTHRGWIVGHDGAILITNDGGLSWSAYTFKEPNDLSLLDVLATDLHHAIAVGAFGTCLITADAGRTWTPRKILDEDLHLNRLTRGHRTEFFLAGERGTLLRFNEIRANPERLNTGYEGSFNGVLLLGERGLLAYGLRGHVFRSEDNGATWSPVLGLPPVLLSTAVKTKTGMIVLAGQARVFLVSQDDGRSFVPWETPLTTAVAKIVEAPDGSLLTFGEGGVNRLRPPQLGAAPARPASSAP